MRLLCVRVRYRMLLRCTLLFNPIRHILQCMSVTHVRNSQHNQNIRQSKWQLNWCIAPRQSVTHTDARTIRAINR